ncbi:MAG TPA: DUF1918 domain-containing protein [Solirubrobacteraceae bacterium]|nr:DUF1918 domain-containing protein [Solirubrobacteraceae bacterium]
MPASPSTSHQRHAKPGDWVHVRGISGQSGREGQILEVLGRPGHEHYRVRWDEQHESILFPADGVTVTPGTHRGR